MKSADPFSTNKHGIGTMMYIRTATTIAFKMSQRNIEGIHANVDV